MNDTDMQNEMTRLMAERDEIKAVLAYTEHKLKAMRSLMMVEGREQARRHGMKRERNAYVEAALVHLAR